MEITLSLTIEETNGVLIALAKMPYEQVQPLIDKIQRQAIPQVPQPPAQPEPEKE